MEETIKPRYVIGFLVAAGYWVVLILGGLLLARELPISDFPLGMMGTLRSAVFGSLWIAGGSLFAFAPRRIAWSESGVSFTGGFPGSRSYTWEQLQAHSSLAKSINVQLFKFAGEQPHQLCPVFFRRKDWDAFRQAVAKHAPNRRAYLWVVVWPYRDGRFYHK